MRELYKTFTAHFSPLWRVLIVLGSVSVMYMWFASSSQADGYVDRGNYDVDAEIDLRNEQPYENEPWLEGVIVCKNTADTAYLAELHWQEGSEVAGETYYTYHMAGVCGLQQAWVYPLNEPLLERCVQVGDMWQLMLISMVQLDFEATEALHFYEFPVDFSYEMYCMYLEGGSV